MSDVQDVPEAWSFIGAIEAFNRPITVRQLAEVLAWSIDSVYREIHDGTLPYIRLRGKLVFDPAALGMHFRRRYPPSAGAVGRKRCSPRPRGPKSVAATKNHDQKQHKAKHG